MSTSASNPNLVSANATGNSNSILSNLPPSSASSSSKHLTVKKVKRYLEDHNMSLLIQEAVMACYKEEAADPKVFLVCL